MAQIEALGARMQLDAPRAGREAALQFRRWVLARVHAAERHEPSIEGSRRGDDRRVGVVVAGRVHQGKGDGVCIRQVQDLQQALPGEVRAVRVAVAEVCVRVEEVQAGHALRQPAEQGEKQLIRIRRSDLLTSLSP